MQNGPILLKAKLTRASPQRLLNGAVALFRMGKRFPVVEHHFCQLELPNVNFEAHCSVSVHQNP